VTSVTTSCGLWETVVFSREATPRESLEVPIITKLFVPFPLTSAVTLYSTKPPEVTACLSSAGSPAGPGRLLQLSALSAPVQSVS